MDKPCRQSVHILSFEYRYPAPKMSTQSPYCVSTVLIQCRNMTLKVVILNVNINNFFKTIKYLCALETKQQNYYIRGPVIADSNPGKLRATLCPCYRHITLDFKGYQFNWREHQLQNDSHPMVLGHQASQGVPHIPQ